VSASVGEQQAMNAANEIRKRQTAMTLPPYPVIPGNFCGQQPEKSISEECDAAHRVFVLRAPWLGWGEAPQEALSWIVKSPLHLLSR
jgi:hypothetical protein